MAILVTKDLCKTYGGGDNAVHALNHVSLTVEEGGICLHCRNLGQRKVHSFESGRRTGQAYLRGGVGEGPRPGETK